MIFQKNKGRNIHQNDLIVDNVVIGKVEQTKFLGVIIDSKLTFHPHINYIKGKVSRGIGILCKAKKFFRESTRLSLYYAFIYPYFIYCITVWGNTYSTFLDTLNKCQKRALRIICGARKSDHTGPLFDKLKILKLRSIYIYAVQIFLYKYQNDKLPNSFANFFVTNDKIHGHFTRQRNLFHPPVAKCHQRISALKASGVKIFNYFFGYVRYDISYVTFKYKLKQTLYALSDSDIYNIC